MGAYEIERKGTKMKLTEKAAILTQRVCIYGAPGTGKTKLAGMLAEKYNLLWFDIDSGYSTLTSLPHEWQERIDVISIPDSRTFPIAIETLLKVVKGDAVDICHEHGKVSCLSCKKDNKPVQRVCLNETKPDTIVVFDSLTQLTNSGIAHITKAQPDDYKLQLDDWGNLRVLMDKFLSQIQAARYNVVCITHEEEVEFDDGRKKLVPVCGSSKSSRNTAKYFDHVIYAEVVNKKHRFGSSTTYGNSIVASSRTGIEMEKATVPTLFDIFGAPKNVETATINKMAASSNSISVSPTNSNDTVSIAIPKIEVALAKAKVHEEVVIPVTVTPIVTENITKSPGDLAKEALAKKLAELKATAWKEPVTKK